VGPRTGLDAVVKVKVFLCLTNKHHAMKTYWGQLSFDMRLGGPQNRFGRGGEEEKKKNLCSYLDSNPIPQLIS
jgi:hypothetical protein